MGKAHTGMFLPELSLKCRKLLRTPRTADRSLCEQARNSSQIFQPPSEQRKREDFSHCLQLLTLCFLVFLSCEEYLYTPFLKYSIPL